MLHKWNVYKVIMDVPSWSQGLVSGQIKIPRCYECKWLSFQLYDDMLIFRVYISSYEL